MAKAKTKSQVIKELHEKCAELIGDKRSFRFISQGYAVQVKPVTKVVVNGFLINLRYSDKFDTPFLDEQDTENKVKLYPVEFDDNECIVSATEMCKLKFLMLHRLNEANGANSKSGASWRLEDKAKEAKDEMSFIAMEDEARNLIKDRPSDEVLAAHSVVLGGDHTMDITGARVALVNLSRECPDKVIDAFDDERTRFKFKFKTALIVGLIYLNDDQTECSWRDTHKSFLTIPKGASMEEEFATYCGTEEGVDVLRRISEQLTK